MPGNALCFLVLSKESGDLIPSNDLFDIFPNSPEARFGLESGKVPLNGTNRSGVVHESYRQYHLLSTGHGACFA